MNDRTHPPRQPDAHVELRGEVFARVRDGRREIALTRGRMPVGQPTCQIYLESFDPDGRLNARRHVVTLLAPAVREYGLALVRLADVMDTEPVPSPRPPRAKAREERVRAPGQPPASWVSAQASPGTAARRT